MNKRLSPHTKKKTKRIKQCVAIITLIIVLLLAFPFSANAGGFDLIAEPLNNAYESNIYTGTYGQWSNARNQLANYLYSSVNYWNAYEKNLVAKINEMEYNYYMVERYKFSVQTPFVDAMNKALGTLHNDPAPTDSECLQTIADIRGIMDKYYEIEKELDAFLYENEATESLTNDVFYIANAFWQALPDYFSFWNGSGGSFFGLDFGENQINAIANTYVPITKTFAYAIAVLFFFISFLEDLLKFQEFDLKLLIKVLLRLVVTKIWIDSAIYICIAILAIISELVGAFLFSSSPGVLFPSFQAQNEGSGLWIIGPLIDLFTYYIYIIPILFLIIITLIAIIKITIRLIMRGFELACLVTLSPIFFAALAGERTQPYFKKFINSFISTCAYLLFIVVVYKVGVEWIKQINISSAGTDVQGYIISMLPKVLIIWGLSKLCIKPPQVLTSLLDA